MSSQSQRWLGDVDELAARDQPVRIDHGQRADHAVVVGAPSMQATPTMSSGP